MASGFIEEIESRVRACSRMVDERLLHDRARELRLLRAADETIVKMSLKLRELDRNQWMLLTVKSPDPEMGCRIRHLEAMPGVAEALAIDRKRGRA